MQCEYSAISCGVRQLCNLSMNFDGMISDMLSQARKDGYYERGKLMFSQVIFSDNLDWKGTGGGPHDAPGAFFAKYLTDNALGTVTASPPIINRNSGNTIQTWIWSIEDPKKVIKHVGWKCPPKARNTDW